MSRISKTDERAIARYLDGAMADEAKVAFELRLRSESTVAAALHSARQESAALRAADDVPVATAPEGFARSVLDRVCRMPSREDLVREVADETTLRLVSTHFRRLLVAACLICGLALLFGLNLWGNSQSGPLKADVEAPFLKELDEKVEQLKAEDLRRGGRRR